MYNIEKGYYGNHLFHEVKDPAAPPPHTFYLFTITVRIVQII